MKQLIALVVLFFPIQSVLGANEIGPEGHKLLWLLIIIVTAILLSPFLFRSQKKILNFNNPFKFKKKITVGLKKDRLYYPDFLELTITNQGNSDVDIDNPVLIFSGFWYNRKFLIKSPANYHSYPVYLDRGQSHKLNIDLNRFYRHDKSLKRLPKVKVIIYEVKGKKLAAQKVFLRKTLLNI